MSDIILEKEIRGHPSPVSIKDTKEILLQMENCICKIFLENGEIGTGFFCKIPFNNNLLHVLITNNHVLNENDIGINKIINIMINNEVKKIEIDNLRIKYTNSDLDITIIEIKPNKDGIKSYLEIDLDDINKKEENIEFEYINKSIYILHYPDGELSVSYGIIKSISDNLKINHTCCTKGGSSGSPILSLKTFKVIGIHYGSAQKSNIFLNYGTYIKHAIDEFNKYYEKINKNENEINIIYKTNDEGIENIFGEKFVEKNKNNIELFINGNKNVLINKYNLRKGENNIKIIIKNKITNLEYMFYDCKYLKKIEGLKYLDTKNINNFSNMFYGCSSLSDIKALQNWNVSNGNDFNWMFLGCSSLSDIKPLENWNVSNGHYYIGMFRGCSSLLDIKTLQNWNLSNWKYKSMII